MFTDYGLQLLLRNFWSWIGTKGGLGWGPKGGSIPLLCLLPIRGAASHTRAGPESGSRGSWHTQQPVYTQYKVRGRELHPCGEWTGSFPFSSWAYAHPADSACGSARLLPAS